MPLHEIDRTDGRDPRAVLTAWCAAVADALGGQLAGAGRFVAEVDCRTRETTDAVLTPEALPAGPPTLTAPARFTDRFGVGVLDSAGRRVAAVVLFVTPDNKADSDGALAFAVRAAGFLSTGVGVVIVDAVPGPANWATHLQSLAPVYPVTRRPRNGETPILVVHPEVRDGTEQFNVWHHLVAPGFPLPTVAVPVRGAGPVTLDLEATYTEACRRSRSPE